MAAWQRWRTHRGRVPGFTDKEEEEKFAPSRNSKYPGRSSGLGDASRGHSGGTRCLRAPCSSKAKSQKNEQMWEVLCLLICGPLCSVCVLLLKVWSPDQQQQPHHMGTC